MKKNNIILLIFLLPVLLYGQKLDTISNWKVGLDMVIEKSENERIDSLVAENGGVLFRANYYLIDSTGKTVEESFFQHTDENGTMEIKLKNGKKFLEQVILKNSSNTKFYYDSGNLEFEENQYYDDDSGNAIRKKYYDNKWNTIEKIYYEKVTHPESFKGIIIEEWQIEKGNLVESLIVEQNVTKKIYLPIQEISFHPNGKIKEKGSFSKRRFFEFRNKDFYEKWLENKVSYIDNYSVILSKRVKVKNGKWEYFDKSGKLIKEEYWEEGKRRK